MNATLTRRPFAAMGTGCSVAVTSARRDALPAAQALTAALREVASCERELSRFDPASDLSRLNAASGRWVEIGPRLAAALAAACDARARTEGRFDPTILPALVAAGYDRSFERLRPRAARRAPGWRAGAEVEVDLERGRARVEAGAAVDLGGIGKGFSAERALAAMHEAWPGMPGGLVDLGGDIATTGSAPEGGPWRVAVADPHDAGRQLAVLELDEAAVATSGRDRRRFGVGGRQHHLIDPTTGEPAVAGPLTVTVVAEHAAQAEVHATALAVTGVEHIADYLRARPGLAALVVPADGPPVALGHLPLTRLMNPFQRDSRTGHPERASMEVPA